MYRSRSLRAVVGSPLALLTTALVLIGACAPSVENDRPVPDSPHTPPSPMLTSNHVAACAQSDIAESSEHRAREIKKQHGPTLLNQPHIHGIGLSRCGSNWVIAMRADENLSEEEQITEIDGVSVIWIRGNPFTAQVREPENAPAPAN